jgi:hypothetical protein
MSIDPLVASMSCIRTIRCSVVAGATLTGLYSHHYLDALSNIYDNANGPVITIAGTTPPLTYPANGSALEKFNTHSNADSLEVRLGSTGSGPLQYTLGLYTDKEKSNGGLRQTLDNRIGATFGPLAKPCGVRRPNGISRWVDAIHRTSA